nr:response regulator [uncultured Marvinbryantia sp.]
MFRILVVDDEYPIREGLIHMITAEHPDFEIDSAKNGLEALEKMETSAFNLLITDIRMPHMDGLELLEEMRAKNISAGVIVLSSYDDYSYVRNAFKNDAVDYLLKTEIDSGKLLEAIDNFRLKKNSASDLHNLCQKLPNALSSNVYTPADFCSLLSSYGDFVPQNSYYCFLLKVSPEKNAKGSAPFLPLVDYAKAKFCLAIAEYLYLGCVEIRQPSLLIQLQRQAAYNRQMQKYNASLLFLYSDIHADPMLLLDDLRLLYRCRGLDFYGIAARRAEHYPATQDAQLKEYSLDIITSLQTGKFDLAHTQIHTLFDFVSSTFYPDIANLKTICQNFCETAYSHTVPLDRNSYYQYTQEIAAQFQAAENASSLQRLLTDALEQLQRRSNSCTCYSQRIAQAVSIIEAHYMDEISLSGVAQMLYISPEYLSRSFKKEVGSNFNAYLNNVRLEHALELLKEPSSRISEVAEKTGFQTPAYFSKCFKTAFGISPQEWKMKNMQ